MDRKRGRPRLQRDSSPPSSRTRSKSPAFGSGRDSAVLKRGRGRKTETPSEEIESSSQSSTPKKQLRAKKEKLPVVIDDSDENDEVADINLEVKRRSTRIATARYRNTPTPIENNTKRSVSRTISSLAKEESEEDESEAPAPIDLGIYSKPWVNGIIFFILLELPIVLHLIAAQGTWNWSALWSAFKKPATYVNVPSLLILIGVRIAIVLISILPFGRIVSFSDRTYKFNGILSAVIIVSVLIGVELKNSTALALIFTNLDRFLYIGMIRNLSVAVITFLHAKHRSTSVENSYGQSGKFVIDFVAGRELNPVFLNRIDVKRVVYNESLIWLLIINITLLFKNVTVPVIESASDGSPINELIKQTYKNLLFVIQNSEYNLAALVVSTFLIIYALDSLVYEHHLASSYQINEEGCGAELLLRLASIPFLVSLLPRFLFTQNVQVCSCALAAIGLFFILGLVIKRCSNCLKYEYHLHPSDPKFKDLITLPTFQNRRLIISRWWSKIRQPNLFGEVLIHTALLLTLAYKFDLASFVGIIAILAYLVYRSVGINRKNALKYESSWGRYVATIKYNLLPRVY